MKRIRYNFLSGQSNIGTEDEPIYEDFFILKDYGWSEGNEETAKLEAYNNEYEIYDDGESEPVVEPTQTERIEALEAAVTMLCMPDMEV